MCCCGALSEYEYVSKVGTIVPYPWAVIIYSIYIYIYVYALYIRVIKQGTQVKGPYYVGALNPKV